LKACTSEKGDRNSILIRNIRSEPGVSSAIPEGKQVQDTTWGTREFGLYDPNGNALFFYRNVN